MKRIANYWNVLAAVFAIGLRASAVAGAAFAYTPLDDPLADPEIGTYPSGVSGSTIVGTYADSNDVGRAFLYENGVFMTLTPSGATHSTALGVSGSNVLLTYTDSSNNSYTAIYNGSTYTVINGLFPNGGATAISGSDIVGTDGIQGILYNGSTYTSIDDPLGTNGTYPLGISGTNIVGHYYDSSYVSHGFLYNGSAWTTLDDPLAGNGRGEGTCACGVSGGDVVGYYTLSSGADMGFLYDGSTYTTLNDPMAIGGGTPVFGIDGNTIVGNYSDSNLEGHGVIITIPEPSSLALLSAGALALMRYVWRRRAK